MSDDFALAKNSRASGRTASTNPDQSADCAAVSACTAGENSI